LQPRSSQKRLIIHYSFSRSRRGRLIHVRKHSATCYGLSDFRPRTSRRLAASRDSSFSRKVLPVALRGSESRRARTKRNVGGWIACPLPVNNRDLPANKTAAHRRARARARALRSQTMNLDSSSGSDSVANDGDSRGGLSAWRSLSRHDRKGRSIEQIGSRDYASFASRRCYSRLQRERFSLGRFESTAMATSPSIHRAMKNGSS